MKKKVIVLDTSAFIAGINPLEFSEILYTVSAVENELNLDSIPWIRLSEAIKEGKVIILKPKDAALQEILKVSQQTGDVKYLSEADLQILASALELKGKGVTPIIITDDYSIQNVANKNKIEFKSLMTFGIKLRFKWILYCPACYKKYPSDYKFNFCEICGTSLKRKPKKKSNL